MNSDPILFYENTYYSFSNFASFAIEWKGYFCMTSEHAYQSEKFEDLEIKEKLLKTEKREIIENSPTDAFWGWGPNKDGQNNLGKLWMEIREEIKNS